MALWRHESAVVLLAQSERVSRPRIRRLDSPRVASNRDERLALNETLFRTANERMADWEERRRADATEVYYCECADRECHTKVGIRASDYERIRKNSAYFFVLPGHEAAEIETVIESHDDWIVVEKDAHIREIAEATNPRRG